METYLASDGAELAEEDGKQPCISLLPLLSLAGDIGKTGPFLFRYNCATAVQCLAFSFFLSVDDTCIERLFVFSKLYLLLLILYLTSVCDITSIS